MLSLILLMSISLIDLLTPAEFAAVYHSDSAEAADLQEKIFKASQCQYYTFQPRPDFPADWEEQTSFVNDNTSSFAICLGGNGSGKTLAAAYKTAKHVLETPPPRIRCPFWIIGEKLDQCAKVCWGEKLSQMIPEEAIYAIRYADTKLMLPKAVLLKHPTIEGEVGWILEFRSYEQGISSLKSESIGGYWCNEEIPYKLIWEIQRGCRDYNSRGWADFTPVECKDPEWPAAYEKPPQGWKFYHLNTLKNPFISEEWKEEFLSNIPEEMVEMRTIGKFTALRGQVFKEFRKHIHVINWQQFEELTGSDDIPHDWHRMRGLDFGFNNPFVCLWIAQDRAGRYYVYDEHYHNRGLIKEHAEEINRRTWDLTMPYYGGSYSDHDPQVRAELSQYGIHCTPANKTGSAESQGIEMIRGLMKVQKDGRPRIYFMQEVNARGTPVSGCSNLIREIIGLKYPDGTTGRNPQDVPLDVNNHSCDALRYALFTSKVGAAGLKPTGMKVSVDGRRHGVLMARDRGRNGR